MLFIRSGNGSDHFRGTGFSVPSKYAVFLLFKGESGFELSNSQVPVLGNFYYFSPLDAIVLQCQNRIKGIIEQTGNKNNSSITNIIQWSRELSLYC